MKISKEISKHYSKLGKMSYKKSPKTKAEYSAMGKKRWAKLSTVDPLTANSQLDIIDEELD